MRDTANFTVFGGVYPAEAYSQNPTRSTSRAHTAAPLAAVLLVLLVVGISATGVVAAMTLVGSSGYGFMLAGNTEISGVPTLREMLW
jgi:hypothetical protein